MKKFIGFVFFTRIFKAVAEIQLLSPIRNINDGITFFNIKLNLDLFKAEHNPKFEFEFEFLNIHNHLWIHSESHDESHDESKEDSNLDFPQSEIERYINLGIDSSKIVTTFLPSVVVWSLTRNKIVSGPDAYEVIEKEDGSLTLTVDNNRFVSLACYSEISEDLLTEIKESKGIIITDQHSEGIYRFGIIPEK
jgi:hypothetical protein